MIFAMLGAAKEQGAGMISHLIDRIGITSILGTLGVKIADTAGVIELPEDAANMLWSLDWLGGLAAIGTITFIVKNIISARKTYLEIQLLKIKDKE